MDVGGATNSGRQNQLLETKLGQDRYFLASPTTTPQREDIHKIQGISPEKERAPQRECKLTTRFVSLRDLALCKTAQSGEAEKSHIASLDVIYSTTLWKKRKKTEIIQDLEIPLCQTCGDKEAKRNWDNMIFWESTFYQTTLGVEKEKWIKKTWRLKREKA